MIALSTRHCAQRRRLTIADAARLSLTTYVGLRIAAA